MLSRQLLLQSRRGAHRSRQSWQVGATTSSSIRYSEHEDQPQQQQYSLAQDQQRRLFHATQRQEIVPLIAVGAVVMIGRYSYKAMNRMDEEWEDYQWQLQQYERHKFKEQADNAPTTVGVDLGTLYLKLSALNGNRPELVPTAQGDRYRFTGIWMQEDINGDDETMVVGRPALEKFFYPPTGASAEAGTCAKEQVILPYRELQKASHDEAAKLVQKVLLPPVGEAMERLASTVAAAKDKNDGSSSNNTNNTDVRTVLTLPPVFYNQHNETIFSNYHDASHHTITVPDPVAAIWGAQALDLLPTPQTKEDSTASTLVVDVGGLATSVSLVKQDKVVASCTLENVGGETFVQQLVDRILQETGDATFQQDAMSLALIHSSARSTVLELVQKTSAKVHIPFLFMGRKPEDPHLNMTISRTVLEQAVQEHWTSIVVPDLLEEEQLSASLPPPTSATSLITSAVTKVLEESQETPNTIQHILLVGGGSKHKMLEQAVQEGIWALMGPSPQKLVLPEASLRAELTALGAASLLPNFDYTYDKGLQRVE